MRIIFAMLALFAAPAAAQAPPKLIVAISVDQFSTDLFNAYRPHFTGGLKRLAGGVAYANGYQAHANTETCPGHATLLTGAHPARSGIIANGWYDFRAARADKQIYCAEDERIAGSTSDDYTVSPAHLRVPTLGDRMKAANAASRVVAVAWKDRSATMLGGHAPDQIWWGGAGSFVGRGTPEPAPIVGAVNASLKAALARPRAALEVPLVCRARDRTIDLGGGKSVGTHRFARAAGDSDALRASPEADGATLALAAGLTREMKLGRGAAPDLLAIGLSATDYVGHRYGPGGVEMCLQLLSLDRDLGAFLQFLDASGVDYAVVLSADHGGLDLPERARGAGQPYAARMDAALTPAAIGAAVAKALGIAEPVFVGDWYIAPGVPQARRAEALALARKQLTAHAQVEVVHSAAEIAAHPMPTTRPERWSVLDRLRASFDPARSPDLAVVLKPNITPIVDPARGAVATHGSVWDYDRKVPILFWRKGMLPADRPESAMTVDIAPTLARWIGLPMPAAEIDGRCLAPAAAC